MVLRSRAVWGALALAVLHLCIFAAGARASVQLLQNGGFESGVAGWSLANASTSGCQPRSGAVALQLSPTPQSLSAAMQPVGGVAGGLGPYLLTGYSKLASGAAGAKAALRWLDDQGSVLADDETALPLGAGYASFAVTTPAAPAGTAGLLVRLIASGGPGSVCIDDVSLDGPPPVTLTPSPTATPTPTATSLPTVTPTKTPSPTRTPVDTKTPPPTKTTRPATATRTPSGTPTSSSSGSGGAQAGLINGSFEAGLAPWQKFGGELRTVSSPVNSGAWAGALTSTTASTKWAFQIVAVDAGETYEFSGFLWAGPGVAEAFLRVSWYASADGSGSMIGSVDSTTRLAGPSESYVYLTTEGVTAPDEAASARLRVMLAPAGGARAVVYLDDFAFGPAEAGPREGVALITPAPEDGAPEATSATTDQSSTGGALPAAPSPGLTAQVRSARAAQSPADPAGPPAASTTRGNGNPTSPALYVLAASVLTAGAMAGAFWHGRRTGGG